MHERNKTPTFVCRFMSNDDFALLHAKFVEAFSDYTRPFDFNEQRFQNHIVLNAVDLQRSVGCFRGSELIGFSLNGFGDWNGKSTVYDAGTGVIPDQRRLGASEAMFNMMFPVLKDAGAEQILLEVITTNDPAVNLYKKLGFEIERELLLLEAPGELHIGRELNMDIDIHQIASSDLVSFSGFGDGKPSWQNSNDAITRSEQKKTILDAFIDNRCVGYIIFTSGLGRVAQFVVDKKCRRRGVGNRLLAAMQTDAAEGCKLQVLNIDSAVTKCVDFLINRGFDKTLSQFEMIKPL